MSMAEFLAKFEPQLQTLIVAVVSFLVVSLTNTGLALRDRRITARKEAEQRRKAEDQELQGEKEEKALFIRMVNDSIDRVQAVEKKLETERSRTDDLETKLAAAVERSNEQADALSVAKAQNDTLARQQATMQLEINSLKGERLALMKELETERNDRKEAESARDRLAVQSAQERERFQQEINTLRTHVEKLESELNTLKPTVQKLETGEQPVGSEETGAIS